MFHCCAEMGEEAEAAPHFFHPHFRQGVSPALQAALAWKFYSLVDHAAPLIRLGYRQSNPEKFAGKIYQSENACRR